MVFKALNHLAPEYINDLFTKVSDTHNRNIRSADHELLHIPSFKTSLYENSFSVSAARFWNTISLDIRKQLRKLQTLCQNPFTSLLARLNKCITFKSITTKYYWVNHLYCPSAQTPGPPTARGTTVPRETGRYAEKLYVTLRYQFSGKPVTDGLREHFL